MLLDAMSTVGEKKGENGAVTSGCERDRRDTTSIEGAGANISRFLFCFRGLV